MTRPNGLGISFASCSAPLRVTLLESMTLEVYFPFGFSLEDFKLKLHLRKTIVTTLAPSRPEMEIHSFHTWPDLTSQRPHLTLTRNFCDLT